MIDRLWGIGGRCRGARVGLFLLACGGIALMASVGLVWAQASLPYIPALPGPIAEAWKRPAPLLVPPLASPATTIATLQTGRTEGEAYLATLSPAEREALLRDGVFMVQAEDPDSPSATGEGDSAAIKGYIRAVALFQQPKQRTLELMLEPANLALFLEELDGAETVLRIPELGELTKFTIEFLWLDIDFWIQHWFYPELSRYEWYLDTVNFDNDIDGNRGFWQLYALDATRTIGEYGVMVDTGIPIPRRWFERIQRRQIPEAMAQFQAYIDSNGTYRKD